ncbi:uncharacterized protein C8R40DRAFT_1133332 [Lentinula edodes]|uniref:uncharacterized protein n=1 Tax=Lentinula edodes TaxID=5353 RepID=UPI001E8D0E1C|nr:uncharacterized protein C8R40DRAFT_1133332 [Lentinula edodes]KAH7868769.1 hypothetical protein C8R40DRAFT_1133332 [Lentinula edodes]
MEAAIYDDFDVYSPFDFDIALDTTIVQSSQSIHAAGVLDSPFALPPNIPASPDALPSDIHANNITYSFGVQYVHETDLWNSCFAHFKRQSRFCFAPRKIFDQLHQLTSPVDKILGTNACPSSMDIVLIQQHIKTLEKQYKTLEDDLCVLRLVLQQLSKEEWALANYMDLHRSLLVSSDQRLAFIAPRVPSVSMSPSQVYIKYIAFEFTSENTDLKLLPAAKYTIRFPVVQSLGPTLDRIEELIEAGDRPSTGEACKIQEILQVAEPAYRNVGQNIFALENVTDRVELELRFIHQNIFLHSALLAPINRVPDEVLREIFSRCFVLAEESLEESDPVLVPFVLGAVNTRWRSIVKLCPLLWSAVRIYLDISMFPSHALSVLSVWLKRAGSTEPLSLKIIFRNSWLSSSYYSNNDKNRSDLQMRVEANIAITIAILRKSAVRWYKLEFINCPAHLLQSFFEAPHAQTPNLQFLTLEGGRMYTGPSALVTPDSPSPCWEMPNGAHFPQPGCPLEQFLTIFELSSIRSLELTEVTLLDFEHTLEFISLCVSLERCKVSFSSEFDRRSTVHVPLSNLVLPNMLDLSLSLEKPDQFLRRLILPRLHHLRVCTVGEAIEQANDMDSVQEMFDRSNLFCTSRGSNVGWYDFHTIPLSINSLSKV